MLSSERVHEPNSLGELAMTEPYTLSPQDRALFEEICFLYRYAMEVVESGQSHHWESVQRRRLELLKQLKARRFDLEPHDVELQSWSDAVRRAEQEFVNALKARLDAVRNQLEPSSLELPAEATP